eukprot:9797625-Heterocapsa_arctica.AAC.1
MLRWKFAYAGGLHKVVRGKLEEIDEMIKITFKKLQRQALFPANHLSGNMASAGQPLDVRLTSA